jgi:hypothetical protein
MVVEFTNSLEALDPDSFVIFAGDFNLYTATEPAYLELLDPTNAIIMLDPIDTPGSWHNNDSFQEIHTQSTRLDPPFGTGAGSGLDDRFDFITFSENTMTDPRLKYVTDSYKSFGNNGNCYNMDISDETCVGEFNQSLRNNLYSMSDHLPVIMQLETNKEFILSSPEFSLNTIISLEKTIVENTINLNISEEFTNEITFSIYNVLGQQLMEFTSENGKKNNFDVSFLRSGLFYIKTNIPNASVLKFIKK